MLEYVDGGDLAAHLDGADAGAARAPRRRTSSRSASRTCTRARDARGLPLGIVHRDVGPANVLVSTTGDVKLGDFGIAKATALADRTAAGTRKGRYAYMAPEQLAGEPVTAAADQFGLGVTLVELVTGASPVRRADRCPPWELLDELRTAAALAELPEDLRAIAQRALAFDGRGSLRVDRRASRRDRREAALTLRCRSDRAGHLARRCRSSDSAA